MLISTLLFIFLALKFFPLTPVGRLLDACVLKPLSHMTGRRFFFYLVVGGVFVLTAQAVALDLALFTALDAASFLDLLAALALAGSLRFAAAVRPPRSLRRVRTMVARLRRVTVPSTRRRTGPAASRVDAGVNDDDPDRAAIGRLQAA